MILHEKICVPTTLDAADYNRGWTTMMGLISNRLLDIPGHTALRGGQMSKLKIGFHSPWTFLHIMVNAWNKKKLILNLFGVWNVG